MWHKSENTVRPLEIDYDSSKVYNIVTKNVEEVVYTDEDGNEATKFVYDEAFIAKEDWEIFASITRNESDIQDVAEALDILATIILEG